MQYQGCHLMLRTLVRSLSLVAILAGTVAVSAPAEAAPKVQTQAAVHKQARKAKAHKAPKHAKHRAKQARKRAKAQRAQ